MVMMDPTPRLCCEHDLAAVLDRHDAADGLAGPGSPNVVADHDGLIIGDVDVLGRHHHDHQLLGGTLGLLRKRRLLADEILVPVDERVEPTFRRREIRPVIELAGLPEQPGAQPREARLAASEK